MRPSNVCQRNSPPQRKTISAGVFSPPISSQPGYVTGIWCKNANGNALSITVWESEQAPADPRCPQEPGRVGRYVGQRRPAATRSGDRPAAATRRSCPLALGSAPHDTAACPFQSCRGAECERQDEVERIGPATSHVLLVDRSHREQTEEARGAGEELPETRPEALDDSHWSIVVRWPFLNVCDVGSRPYCRRRTTTATASSIVPAITNTAERPADTTTEPIAGPAMPPRYSGR